jgi:hypothetical protein
LPFTCNLHRYAAVEDLKLFGKRISGGARPKSVEELKTIVFNSKIPMKAGAAEEVEEVDMDSAL